MTDDLNDLLTRRAERAPAPHDPDTVVALVAARAEAGGRRRRNRLTVASGAVVVVAAATVGIVVADSGSASHPTVPTRASGVASSSAAAPSTGVKRLLPEIGPLNGTATGHGIPIGSAQQEEARAAQRVQALQQRQLQQRAAAKARRARLDHGSDHGTVLVQVAPAPPSAEISLGLVPQGFQYLSLDDANTYYGTPGTTPGDYFSDGIVVDVHQYIGQDTDYTLTVDGKPASYNTSDGYTLVRVRYSKQVDIGFQAPPAAHLTQAQALRMASTLDVRSTTHRTHG